MVKPVKNESLFLALCGMISLAAALGIGRFAYTPILPYMLSSKIFDPVSGGWIASANFFGYLVGALGAAFFSPPGKQRFWFLFAVFLSAATTILVTVSIGPWQQATIRFVGGIASAMVLVYASELIIERLDGRGNSVLSNIHFSGVGFGIAFSAVIVTLIDGLGGGWQVMWGVSGMVALISLGVILLLIPSFSPIVEVEKSGREFEFSNSLIKLIFAYGLFGFGYVITATFLSVMVRGDPLLSPFEWLFWLAVGLAAIPSVALWSAFGRRVNLKVSFAVACVAEALGVMLSVAGLGPIAVMIASILLGGTFMGITALGLILARDIVKGSVRKALAWMTVAFGTGQMIGPAFAGVIFKETGSFFIASVCAAIALFVGALMVMTVGQKHSHMRRVISR